ncbi:hypothetical protein SUGI_0842660 [Cryptomeria japonica]|nr:hypothetical protein SUGI_0842660 [Cryptomeria japonica]
MQNDKFFKDEAADEKGDRARMHFSTNQQLLDYYKQSLFQAFHQVEELERIARESDVFKKSHGRRSSKMTPF